MSVLSDRLRELRGTTSQAEMARLLNMKQPQWARYESGASSPSVELLATICRVHACSADWLLGIDKRGTSVNAGAGAAVAIGANARASVRGKSIAGELPQCSRCCFKKRIEKIEKAMKGR